MALDMNYTPTRLVDITTLTEDQWLDWRKKGIGGSDVAAALNMSPYRTARDLYYDKIGVVPAVEGPDKSITFQIGHLLEDVVAQIFAKKTGLTVYEDHWMYQHPLYPFLIADVDRFVLLPDGRKAILECKTAHYDMQFKWANGAVPRHYELQVRHYMSVMNIDVAFIACLFSNNENDFVWQKIERDVEEEENTVLALEAFWNNHVLARVEPPLVEKPDSKRRRRIWTPSRRRWKRGSRPCMPRLWSRWVLRVGPHVRAEARCFESHIIRSIVKASQKTSCLRCVLSTQMCMTSSWSSRSREFSRWSRRPSRKR